MLSITTVALGTLSPNRIKAICASRGRNTTFTVYRLNRRALAIALAMAFGLILLRHCSPVLATMLDTQTAIRSVQTDEQAIAITFDDGPDPTTTPLILDLLARYHAHATFFVIGSQAERNPEMLRAIVGAGHEVGSHTFSHQRVTGMSQSALTEELKLTAAVIDDACGVKPVYFRPPDYALSSVAARTLDDQGYTIVLWDSDARDWERPGVNRIVSRVTENAHSGGIVLMHDGGGDRSQTVAALAKILQDLSEQGYHFLTVSELLRTGNERR